jgi:hypothetical protein
MLDFGIPYSHGLWPVAQPGRRVCLIVCDWPIISQIAFQIPGGILGSILFGIFFLIAAFSFFGK